MGDGTPVLTGGRSYGKFLYDCRKQGDCKCQCKRQFLALMPIIAGIVYEKSTIMDVVQGIGIFIHISSACASMPMRG